LGLSGRVPPRVDAATKAGLLHLVEQAVQAGWEFRAACRVLELGTVRAYRWLGRRAADELADHRPGGSPLHGLLPEEVAEIVALFHQWGEVDRSHRKLAHRGSYLERVWVSPASVRRVLAAEGLRLRPLPRPGRSVRKPFPDWVEYRPRSIWIYDTTHFTRAGVAATVVEDLVSRKWIAEIVSAEETATQIQVVFTEALEREELLDRVTARQDGLVDPTVDDPSRPVLLAMSDNGPQMTSGSTREFLALCAIHQHFGRPGTPTDQAWTWVAVRPRQGRVAPPCQDRRPGRAARRARGGPRALQHGAAARRHRLRHPRRRAPGPRPGDPQDPRSRTRAGPAATHRLPSRPAPSRPCPTRARPVRGARRCWLIDPGSVSRTQKQVTAGICSSSESAGWPGHG
jgi:putative transposase